MTYYWKCQYNDGTEISSKDGAKYKDIDREKIEKFVLLQVNNDKPVLVLNLHEWDKLIVRMRTAIKVQSGEKMTIWIVGLQGPENNQTVCFVFPDGTIEVTDGFREGHRWFYPINFLPEEQ